VGEGAFGEVFKGILDETSNNHGVPGYLVACKSVTDPTGDGAADLLQEATVMAQIGNHVNLVSLIGVVTSGVPLLIIIALCENGSLKSQLERRVLGEGKLTAKPGAFPPKIDADIGVEIARGMHHLVEHHLVHRDLAARNVLLDSQLVAKVADFGLSRGGGGESSTAEDEDAATHEDYYKSSAGVFPVRWTAPEAMETLRFTPASDVWSFGIVVIELLTDGVSPYFGMSNPDVMKLTLSGGRHAKPPLCSNKLYDTLLQCWDEDDTKRPTFSFLCDAFKEMYTVSSKSADANAARVEAATNDKLKRGEAANQYSSFDAPEQGSAGGSSAVNFGREGGQVVHNPLFDAAVVNAPSGD
jgi:serine/threonine protein kinase